MSYILDTVHLLTLKRLSVIGGYNIYMAFACQEKTTPIDRKVYENNLRLCI